MPITQQRSATLLDQFGRPMRIEPPKPSRGPRATYDAADTNAGTYRHWANADGLSAKAANSPEVRRKLRERARLEADNGGNCKGTIETIAHDLVGCGPWLMMTVTDDLPEDAAEEIERKFRNWCDDLTVNFADKLRVMVESELRDGESFALLTVNQAVEGPVKFDFRVIETDQISTPLPDVLDPTKVDGIEFDATGNPIAYHLLTQHPGDLTGLISVNDYTRIPADQMIHWFRPSRAGHVRGIPRITPGLPLHAQLRGYASATLAAARLASQYAAVLSSTLPPDGYDAEVDTYDKVPVHDGGMVTLPYGFEMNQFEPTQPTSTFKEFREGNLTEFGRAIHCPKNVVTGDSSGMNFSSSRLDHLMYRGAIRIERNRISIRVLDRLFKAWLEEALVTAGYLTDATVNAIETAPDLGWCWRFDGFPSINPTDDATADRTNLESGLTTHAELLGERGIDWRDHFRAIAEQRALARELDIEDLLYPWLVKAQAATTTAATTTTNRQPRGPAYEAEVDTVLEGEVAHVR